MWRVTWTECIGDMKGDVQRNVGGRDEEKYIEDIEGLQACQYWIMIYDSSSLTISELSVPSSTT